LEVCFARGSVHRLSSSLRAKNRELSADNPTSNSDMINTVMSLTLAMLKLINTTVLYVFFRPLLLFPGLQRISIAYQQDNKECIIVKEGETESDLQKIQNYCTMFFKAKKESFHSLRTPEIQVYTSEKAHKWKKEILSEIDEIEVGEVSQMLYEGHQLVAYIALLIGTWQLESNFPSVMRWIVRLMEKALSSIP